MVDQLPTIDGDGGPVEAQAVVLFKDLASGGGPVEFGAGGVGDAEAAKQDEQTALLTDIKAAVDGLEAEVLSQTELVAALKSATATHSSVNSGTSSVTILAGNANRKGARIRNSDANALHLDLTGGTATVDRAQVTLVQNESYPVDAGYTGAITGIWAADGSGVGSVAEFTA